MSRVRQTLVVLAFVSMVVPVLAGCSSGIVPLMPTPALYTVSGVSPLDHVPEAERWVPRRVYYATVRGRRASLTEISYGNASGDDVSMGLAIVGFGRSGTTWEDLRIASTTSTREGAIQLTISGIVEAGRFPRTADVEEAARPERAGWILEDMGDAIADARDKDVLIYVHGAKVDFYNACAYAAQLDHFMGRDMTSLAFSWPSRQNMAAYAFGSDIKRARASAPALATVIELVATRTEARRIHLLAWSAGGRVLTEALTILRARHADLSNDDARARLRLGTIYFAAADVPTDRFLDALPAIHALGDAVIVSASSGDAALEKGRFFMGGDVRIGETQGGRPAESEASRIDALERFQYVDVSAGSEGRGFDILGHRYWFDHPWASTDLLLSIRSDLPPEARQLERVGPNRWAIPPDYLERLERAIESGEGTLRDPGRGR